MCFQKRLQEQKMFKFHNKRARLSYNVYFPINHFQYSIVSCSENTHCKVMLYNINQFKKDPKEDVSLQHISILLNRINKTFELLDQQVSVYCHDVKNHAFLFYGPRDDFKNRVQIVPDIQKELEVYHYYKEVTLKFLCEFLCSRIVKKLAIYGVEKNK